MLDNDTQGKKYFLVYPIGDDPAESVVYDLKRVDAKVVGGVFSYDMLGVKGSSIRYEAYNGNDGAEEFVDRINELVDTYKPYNVTSVEATSNSSQPTDVTTYWNNGYVCAWHTGGVRVTAAFIP